MDPQNWCMKRVYVFTKCLPTNWFMILSILSSVSIVSRSWSIRMNVNHRHVCCPGDGRVEVLVCKRQMQVKGCWLHHLNFVNHHPILHGECNQHVSSLNGVLWGPHLARFVKKCKNGSQSDLGWPWMTLLRLLLSERKRALASRFRDAIAPTRYSLEQIELVCKDKDAA